jgi:hypothetical protein
MKALRVGQAASLDEIWCPPPGHSFASLFATTFTLEEAVLGELAIRFVPERTRNGITTEQKDVNILKAILQTALKGSFEIAYDTSALAMGERLARSRYGIFASHLSAVKPVRKGKHYSHFHPKIYWALFKDQKRINRARIVIGSQNLSLSQFLEAGLVLEFEVPKKTKSYPQMALVDGFLNDLVTLVGNHASPRLKKQLLSQTKKMICTSISGDIRELSLFNPKKHKQSFGKILARAGELKQALFISPFIRKGQLNDLDKISERTGAQIGIISLQHTLDSFVEVDVKSKKPINNPFPNLRFGTSKVFGVDTEDLHAKISWIRGADSTRLIIGSSNLTHGGWQRNFEANAEMRIRSSPSEFSSLWKKLKPLPDLIERPGEDPEDLETIANKTRAWLSEWTIDWTALSQKRQHNKLPLEVRPTTCPPDLHEKLTAQNITLRCCEITSVSTSFDDYKKIDLKTLKPFCDGDLNPLVEVSIGDIRHWLIPDYSKFPAKSAFEEIQIEDLIRALSLLLRPNAKREIDEKQKGKKLRYGGASVAGEVNLEKVIISFVNEHHPERIGPKDRLARATDIEEWIRRSKKSVTSPEHEILIKNLSAVAKALRNWRAAA